MKGVFLGCAWEDLLSVAYDGDGGADVRNAPRAEFSTIRYHEGQWYLL